jgi:histone-lysine N-methyltransferase SETD8
VINQDHDYDGNKVQPHTEKPFKAPSVPADGNKKVTEFFVVRRSVRKTKKEVQEERMRNIEQAIREGREEGLAVS